MSITYGGVGLAQPPADLLARWDRHRDAHTQEPTLPRGFLAPGLAHLPLPAYSDHLYRTVHLNRLVWPTLASRWAVFHALATQRQLEDIYTAGGSEGNPLYLEIGTLFDPATGGRLATSMYLLPPRAVFDGYSLTDALYLLTLVDERWFWWQAAPDSAPDAASWTALLTGLLAAVGVGSPTIDTIHADYLTPDPDRWAGLTYRPAPVLIDAACESVGCRLVRAFDGTVRVLSGTNARAREQDNWTATRTYLLVGGLTPASNFGPSLPEKVTVVFPGVPPAAEDVTLADTAVYPGTTGRAGRAGLLHAELAATADAGERTGYAAVAAADWYRWAVSRVDAVFGGIRSWPTGLEDRTEYEWSPPLGGERSRVLTRVVPWPAWDRNRYGGRATAASGSSSADCRSPLAGLRRDEQVAFNVLAGYGVDTATVSGFWSASAPGGAGWMSAGTVRTSAGDTTLVLFNKADGGKGLRLVADGVDPWYGEDIDCQDCGRLFSAAITPPALESEGSASGGSGGTPCADHTFRVCVKCRAPVLYTGCQAVPEGVVCWKLWQRDLLGLWHAYDIGSYGPVQRWWPTYSSDLCTPTTGSLNRCGWYVPGYSSISGNVNALSLMVLYNAGNGGWIWSGEVYNNCPGGIQAISPLRTPPGFDSSDPMAQLDTGSYTPAGSQPAPTDRPWRLWLGPYAYVQAYFSEEECAAVPVPPPLPPPPPPPPGPPPPPPPPPGGGCCDGEGESLEEKPNLAVTATDGPLSTTLGVPFVWTGSQYFCNATSVFAALACSGGTWTVTVNGGAYTATATSVSCDPFGLVFDNTELGGTGDATITLESP